MNKLSSEKLGMIFVLISAMLGGIFPVVINRGSQIVPPITFAALATLFAGLGLLVYILFNRQVWPELGKTKAYPYLGMVTICIVIVPSLLFFIGASKTSGINTAMLLLTELIFTLLLTPLMGEKNNRAKIIGASGVFLGGLFILYNGEFKLSLGDVLIILSTVTYPIGNFYSKKALNLVSPAVILFTRFILGGSFLLLVARVAEPTVNLVSTLQHHWLLLAFTGLVVFALWQTIWYAGLRRLDISKAISLGLTSPLFSLFILLIIFKESISVYQAIGAAIMLVGIFYSAKRRSTELTLTKYAPKVD